MLCVRVICFVVVGLCRCCCFVLVWVLICCLLTCFETSVLAFDLFLFCLRAWCFLRDFSCVCFVGFVTGLIWYCGLRLLVYAACCTMFTNFFVVGSDFVFGFWLLFLLLCVD